MVKRRKPIARKTPLKRTPLRARRSPIKRAGTRIRPSARSRAKKAAQRPVVQRVRADVWERSGGVCECCRQTEPQTFAASGTFEHEMHECHSRQKTQGRPPEQRFDTRWCVRLCAACHRVIQGSTLLPMFQDVTAGANGAMRFVASGDRAALADWFTARDVWERATGERAA